MCSLLEREVAAYVLSCGGLFTIIPVSPVRVLYYRKLKNDNGVSHLISEAYMRGVLPKVGIQPPGTTPQARHSAADYSYCYHISSLCIASRQESLIHLCVCSDCASSCPRTLRLSLYWRLSCLTYRLNVSLSPFADGDSVGAESRAPALYIHRDIAD